MTSWDSYGLTDEEFLDRLREESFFLESPELAEKREDEETIASIEAFTETVRAVDEIEARIDKLRFPDLFNNIEI